MEGQQLVLELFEQLEEAVRLPEEMSVRRLIERMDQTMEGMSHSRQMEIAGEALTQLVAAFAERAELMLFEWEDRYNGPLMQESWLAELVERPPTFNLASYETELVELPKSPKRKKPSSGTRIRYLSKTEALSDLKREGARTLDEIVELAHDENIEQTELAIAEALKKWGGEATLSDVAKTLVSPLNSMLLVLAVLLSSELMLVSSDGDFYSSANRLVIQQVRSTRENRTNVDNPREFNSGANG